MAKLAPLHSIQLPSAKALAAAISPDGKYCAAGDRDGFIHLIDIKSGEIARKLGRHVEFVYTLTFNPDNGRLVSAGKDKSIREWDIETGEFVTDHARIFTPSGPRTMASQACKASTRSHTMTILSAACDKGGLMATSGQDNRVKYWKDGEPVRTYDWHSGPVTSVRFQPGTQILFSASRDKTIRSWNDVTGAVIHRYSGHLCEIVAMEFLDEQHFATADASGQIVIWHTEQESPLVFLHKAPAKLMCMTSLPSKKVVLAGLENGTIEAVRTGYDDSFDHSGDCGTFTGHEAEVRCLCAHKSDIVASGDNSGKIILWKYTDRK